MNLLGRRRSGLLLILALIFWRCEDPLDISLEEDKNTDKFGVFYRDIQIPASIVYFDSLVTSNQDFLLAGYHQDDKFGELNVTGYSEARLGNIGRSYDTAFYDSLVLELPIDYRLGKFPSLSTLTVYQLADTFRSGGRYFNLSEIPLESESLGSLTFDHNPNEDSVITIRLDDDLGQDFFDKAVSGDTTFSSQAEFSNYFKGFAIKGEDGSGAVFGFNVENTKMVMHYHEVENGEVDTLTYNFPIENGQRFHNVRNDRTGTPLEGLTQPHTEFITNDGFSYLHEGIGLVLKLDFNEALQPLKDSIDYVVVNRADLQVGVLQPFTTYLAPPQTFRLAFVSEENKLIINEQGFFSQVQSDYANQLSSGNEVVIPLVEDERLYRNDGNNAITGFTQALINGSLENGEIYFYPLTMNERLGRMIVDSRFIQLKLYFTIPK